jgi:protein-tyrosine phosphatase
VGTEGLNIITVCTANICRSPVAHVLLTDRLGGGALVTSGGTRGLVGSAMDPRSATALGERELGAGGLAEAEVFRASALTAERVSAADLVLTATTAHRDDVIRMTPRALKRTFTLLEFAALADAVEAESARELVATAARRRRHAGSDLDIADPVGIDEVGYREVMHQIDGAVARIAARLRPVLSVVT